MERQPGVAGSSYIRGSGAVPVDPARLGRILLVLIGAAVAALTVVFAVEAFQRNARVDALRDRGVAIEASVSGCVGLASGTGITEVGYQCRANFTYGGRAFNEPIHGTAQLFPVGQKVAAIAERGNPAIAYTAASVGMMRSTWTVWITPLALLLLLVMTVLFRRRLGRAC